MTACRMASACAPRSRGRWRTGRSSSSSWLRESTMKKILSRRAGRFVHRARVFAAAPGHGPIAGHANFRSHRAGRGRAAHVLHRAQWRDGDRGVGAARAARRGRCLERRRAPGVAAQRRPGAQAGGDQGVRIARPLQRDHARRHAALARHAGDEVGVPRVRRWRGVSLRGAGRCRSEDPERALRRHGIHIRRRLRLHGLQHRRAWIPATKASSIRSRRAASASTTTTTCRWCAARRRTPLPSARPTCATTAACISAGAVTAGPACRRAFRGGSTTAR